jgi:hypothetical protein
MRAVSVVTWVVFERPVPGKSNLTIVCEQSEWDLMEETQRNDCVLLRAGIVSEGEAEQLARSVAMPEKVKPVVGGAMPPLPRPAGSAQTTAMTAWWSRSKRLADSPSG